MYMTVKTSFPSLSAWPKMGLTWPYRQHYFLGLGPKNQLSPFLLPHSWTVSPGSKTKDSLLVYKTIVSPEELLLQPRCQ